MKKSCVLIFLASLFNKKVFFTINTFYLCIFKTSIISSRYTFLAGSSQSESPTGVYGQAQWAHPAQSFLCGPLIPETQPALPALVTVTTHFLPCFFHH